MPGIKDNEFLANLPNESLARLTPHIEWVDFAPGERPLKEPIDALYFPVSGLVSFVLTTQSGVSSELAITGREGMLGFIILFDNPRPIFPAVVQHQLRAAKLNGKMAVEEFHQNRLFWAQTMGFLHAFYGQVAQTALCNAHHTLEQRFCRWLLMIHDRLGDGSHVSMTQEMIANMLGVRREAVSRVANRLKSQGLITSGTRRIEVEDRIGVQDASCECYETLKREYDALSEFPYN